MRQKIEVYGRESCGLCKAAVEKLELLGVPHEKKNIDDYRDFHKDWRDDGSVEVNAAYALIGTLPVIKMGSDYLSYPQAMRRLKEREIGPEKAQTRD